MLLFNSTWAPPFFCTHLIYLNTFDTFPIAASEKCCAVQETPLPNRFQANEVFSSQDIEDKVSLQAVLRKCSITSSNAQRHDKLGSHQYTCALEYDSTAVQLSMTAAL